MCSLEEVVEQGENNACDDEEDNGFTVVGEPVYPCVGVVFLVAGGFVVVIVFLHESVSFLFVGVCCVAGVSGGVSVTVSVSVGVRVRARVRVRVHTIVRTITSRRQSVLTHRMRIRA